MKMYSAFISSAFKSLRDERSDVIDALLMRHVFPVCQEYFTVSEGKWNEITEFIEEANYFVIILGKEYGSEDSEGVSWTEREYDYAKSIGKPILAIKCGEYRHAKGKQRAFGERLEMARQVDKEFTIERIVLQWLETKKPEAMEGWISEKDINRRATAEFERWKKDSIKYNLAGEWYHVHTGNEVDNYVRVGELHVEQIFDKEHYKYVSVSGVNYHACLLDGERLVFDKIEKVTEWTADYRLRIAEGNHGELEGIYTARRRFNGAFGDQNVERGEKKGVHSFAIDGQGACETTFFQGEFNDVYPSPKKGRIFVFRNPSERDAFLIEYMKAHDLH